MPNVPCTKLVNVITAAQEGLRKLYHYQSARLDYLKDTLIHNRVHFSNPENFNDPWDCRPYFDCSIDDPERRKEWGERLGGIFEGLPVHLRMALAARTPGKWYDHQELLRRSIERLTAEVWHLNCERWRIYCLTSRLDSVLMWSHYADQHKGICLEFDVTRDPIGRAYKVLYSEVLPAIGPDTLVDSKAMVDSVLLTKARAWCYEDEYRILARDESVDPGFAVTTDKDFLILPKGALTSVVAGCNADIEAIHSLAKECAPELPVKRAVRSAQRYELEVVEDS